MVIKDLIQLAFKKFNDTVKSSAFQESSKIIFMTNYLWNSIRFYFKKTKSIQTIDFTSTKDFNGFQTESREMFEENTKYNLNLK